MANQTLMPKGAKSGALLANAAVGDEIGRAGAGFGELVERTGAAVAATQNLLNDTGARTATALAETLVDVVAVQEKVYRDDGSLDTSIAHTRKLPLISFIDPVFYKWSSVRVQGRFWANEFSSEVQTDTSSGSSGSGGVSASAFGISLGAGYNYNRSSSSSGNVERTTDSSVGQMRMNALLEPRSDVSIPKPNQVIRGPRLSLIQGALEDVLDGAALVARTMSLLIQFNRRDGSPIAGKAISVESDGIAWSYVGGPLAVTDGSGQVEITLRRDFVGETPDTTPTDFIVSARVGLVQNSIGVTL